MVNIVDTGDFKKVQVPNYAFYITELYPACPVQIDNWIMLVDLLVLKRLEGFDVVLGMDWLT